MAIGLKARVVFSHTAGLQVVIISCNLPRATTTAANTEKRRCRCHHHQRRGRVTTTVGASTDRSPATAAVAVAPAAATSASKSASTPPPEAASSRPPSLQQPVPPFSSPEVNTPPAKQTRRRCNKVELLRGLVGEGELLLSSLSCTASPLLFSLPLPSRSHMSSTALPPLLLLAPLDLEPASPVSSPHAPPTFPASLPPALAPLSSSSSPLPPPSPSPLPPPSPSPTPQPAASTIPAAPPMSIHFPLASFKVISRLCLRNSHNISYKQCPYCYKSGGGLNYTNP